MTYPSQNNGLYKKLIIISYVFSVAVFILVGLMRQVKINPVSYTHLDVYKRQAYISQGLLLHWYFQYYLLLVNIPPGIL